MNQKVQPLKDRLAFQDDNSTPLNLKSFTKDINSLWDITPASSKEEWDFEALPKSEPLEELFQGTQKFSRSLLLQKDLNAPPQFATKLKKLINCYSYAMGEFLPKIDKWSDLREKNIRNIQESVKKFCLLKRTTTGMTLFSSTLEFLLGCGSLMSTVLPFSMNSRYSPLLHAFGGLSMVCSFSALMYSNHTIEDIIKDIRDEKYLLRDLEVAYRRGNWIDKDVQDLFPHGINLKLVKQLVFDANGNLLEHWKQQILAAIILTNTKKDKMLLHDEKFLASAKAFVESQAAQFWINRVKLRHLLDEMTKQLEELPVKKSINGNEVFLNLAAINMYPLFFSLFSRSGKSQETKFLGNSLAAIAAAFSFSDSEDEAFEDMKRISEELRDYHRHVKKVTRNLATDYD